MKQLFASLKDKIVAPDIPTIEARRARALAAFEQARAELGNALADDREVEPARKALTNAERTLIEVDALLDAAKSRHARAQADAEAQAAANKQAAISAALTRLKAAGTTLDGAVDALVAAADELLAAERAVADAGADQPTQDRMCSANHILALVLGARLPAFSGFKRVMSLDQRRLSDYLPA